MALTLILRSTLALGVSWYLWAYISSPLKSFPNGHWSSGVSNVWRFLDVWSMKAQWTHIRLHERYGSAVRMGPNIVNISDPYALKDIFRSRDPWKKTPFYGVNDVMVQGHRVSNVFGTTNEEWHTRVMKPIKGLYSMTRALDMEPHIDTSICEFLKAIDSRFAGVSHGKMFDMASWVPFFTWGSMGRQTFGEPYGMLNAGTDAGSLIDTSTRGLRYFAPVSQIPTLDLLLDKNPIKRIGPPSFGWATVQAFAAVAKRKEEPTRETTRHSDFLDKFLQCKEQYPGVVDYNQVVNYLLVNILAGSDTTSIYICSAIYHILRTPGVLERVQAELDGLSHSSPVSWKDIQRLPYFRAVMQEAARIHPGVGIMLERYVPSSGYTLPDGRFLPGGTIVGCNPWVINHLESIYGERPHDFMPERWLQRQHESEEAFVRRVKDMHNMDLTFGMGKRKCTGLNVGILTANKCVASIFGRYDISLADPSKQWQVKNSWFVYQYGIEVIARLRQGRRAFDLSGHE